MMARKKRERSDLELLKQICLVVLGVYLLSVVVALARGKSLIDLSVRFWSWVIGFLVITALTFSLTFGGFLAVRRLIYGKRERVPNRFMRRKGERVREGVLDDKECDGA